MRVRGCALIREKGKILVLVYDYPNGRIHAIPGGGVKEGESLAESVIREYREELGIEVAIDGLRYVGDMMARENIKQTVHVVFDGHIVAGEPRLNPAETSAKEVTWLPETELATAKLYPAVNTALIADSDNNSCGARYLGNCMSRDWA
jgi:ADP-ribose pyrophosphatase YjhB (NUDIX family)